MTTPFMRAYTELLVRPATGAVPTRSAGWPRSSRTGATRRSRNWRWPRCARTRNASRPTASMARGSPIRTSCRWRPRSSTRCWARPPTRRAGSGTTSRSAPRSWWTCTVPGGAVTAEGVRVNISVAVRYLDSWLRGVGAAAIDNLMEDAATAEISRGQLWQWRVTGTVLDDGAHVRRRALPHDPRRGHGDTPAGSERRSCRRGRRASRPPRARRRVRRVPDARRVRPARLSNWRGSPCSVRRRSTASSSSPRSSARRRSSRSSRAVRLPVHRRARPVRSRRRGLRPADRVRDHARSSSSSSCCPAWSSRRRTRSTSAAAPDRRRDRAPGGPRRADLGGDRRRRPSISATGLPLELGSSSARWSRRPIRSRSSRRSSVSGRGRSPPWSRARACSTTARPSSCSSSPCARSGDVGVADALGIFVATLVVSVVIGVVIGFVASRIVATRRRSPHRTHDLAACRLRDLPRRRRAPRVGRHRDRRRRDHARQLRSPDRDEREDEGAARHGLGVPRVPADRARVPARRPVDHAPRPGRRSGPIAWRRRRRPRRARHRGVRAARWQPRGSPVGGSTWRGAGSTSCSGAASAGPCRSPWRCRCRPTSRSASSSRRSPSASCSSRCSSRGARSNGSGPGEPWSDARAD